MSLYSLAFNTDVTHSLYVILFNSSTFGYCRCSRQIDGVLYDPNGKNFACTIERTGRPSASCQFVDAADTNSKASIMYNYELNSVSLSLFLFV